VSLEDIGGTTLPLDERQRSEQSRRAEEDGFAVTARCGIVAAF
jgi:hypothetical protein